MTQETSQDVTGGDKAPAIGLETIPPGAGAFVLGQGLPEGVQLQRSQIQTGNPDCTSFGPRTLAGIRLRVIGAALAIMPSCAPRDRVGGL
jgi:hypothetical protein